MPTIGRLLGKFSEVEAAPSPEFYGLCDELSGNYRFATDVHATLSMLPQGNVGPEILAESIAAREKLAQVLTQLHGTMEGITAEVQSVFNGNKKTYDGEKENFFTRREELRNNQTIRKLVGNFLSQHATCMAYATVLLKHKPEGVEIALPPKEPLKPGAIDESALGSDTTILFGSDITPTRSNEQP